MFRKKTVSNPPSQTSILQDKNIWGVPFEDVLTDFQVKMSGLTESEVSTRHLKYGLNVISQKNINFFNILIRQFRGNPLILILAAATLIAFFLGQQVSSYYIFGMIVLSVILGFWNEYSAEKTVDSLLKHISQTALVIRNDEKKEIPVKDLTVGDIVFLSEGSIVPCDMRIISSKNLEVNQSALTGESKTAYKTDLAISKEPTEINGLENIAFMGTVVENGSGKGVVVRIGHDTEFGKIAKSTIFTKPQTDFQKGLANFGSFLVKVIFILTIAIFGINALLGHKILDSLIFSLAIAVGLTPELLPIIVTVSLSHGAGKLAKKKVVAKQLIAIENLGNMDVLCTDKTGTLTEGSIELIDYLDIEGKRSHEVLTSALLCNSAVVHHTVLGNSMDVAIWKYAIKNQIHPDHEISKLEEEPFDYNKKAMYSVVVKNGRETLIAKGAPAVMLKYCKHTAANKKLEETVLKLNSEGLRAIIIAQKSIGKKESYDWDDVSDLDVVGYLTFLDIPKVSVKESLAKFTKLNVAIKVLTGDNEIITKKVCSEVGMKVNKILLGQDLEKMSDADLKKHVNDTDVFARLNPEQKLRVINALRSNGHTVGYLGDGINDAPSLHSADVGISVNSAVDVAKDAAAIVLLHKSLDVIADGIVEGRRTFNNTIKYILMGTSSNFGNMFSAAGASFFLPFLPMTPSQILLTNGLYDISQLSIPSDNVDHESLLKPRHWNIGFIKKYMIFFGPISSVYDFLTFGVMYFFFHARGPLFQTGWFIESMATEILVVFVIRTSKTPFFMSKPSIALAVTCLGIVGLAVLLPFTPLAVTLGFVTPPPLYFLILIVLVSTYLLLVESLKKIFLKNFSL